MNIRISGFGGQGVILSGVILGWAAILDGKNAIQTQSYGSEARGGACKCDVIIQSTDIYELEPSKLDILISLSQSAYNKFNAALKHDGSLFIDSDLVLTASHPAETFTIPATDIAYKKLNYKIMANSVMLGFLISQTKLLSPKSLELSIKKYVPEKFYAPNIEAFRIGMEYLKNGN